MSKDINLNILMHRLNNMVDLYEHRTTDGDGIANHLDLDAR